MTVPERIEAVFAQAGARGYLHARELGGEAEVSVGGDDRVVLASVFKIFIVLAYARAVAQGRLDPTGRTTVRPRYRVGGIGTAGCADDVQLSWRDAAGFMMSISDNAVTDLLYHRLGGPAVQAVIDDLGLTHTRLIGCCEDVFASLAVDLGCEDTVRQGRARDEGMLRQASEGQIWNLRALDPNRTSSSTPREISSLLRAIWLDLAAPATACAEVREIMARQVWPHRLSAGFGDEVRIAAKTGTLPAIRNEAGVLDYPDGSQYAISVFTRAESLGERQPAIDQAIGTAARIAVDALRG